MIKSIALLVLVLSNHGHWIGGQPAEVNIQPATDYELPAQAQLNWSLHYHSKVVLKGKSTAHEGQFEPIVLKVPEVRVPVEMKLVCQWTSLENGEAKTLETQEAVVHVYPDNLLQPIKALVAKQELFVWDDAEGLPALFSSIDVPHQAIRAESGLAFQKPDLLLVGSQQLGQDLRDQSRVLALANAGTSVCIFRQNSPLSIDGYLLKERLHPTQPLKNAASAQPNSAPPDEEKETSPSPVFHWRENHTLARHRNLLSGLVDRQTLNVLRLPADEPVLEVAYWADEANSKLPPPIDVLLAVKSVGAGRIVFCQLPLGDWKSDPRSQLFLCDLMDYLNSPVQRTLRPSERKKAQKALPPIQTTVPQPPNLIDTFEREKNR